MPGPPAHAWQISYGKSSSISLTTPLFVNTCKWLYVKSLSGVYWISCAVLYGNIGQLVSVFCYCSTGGSMFDRKNCMFWCLICPWTCSFNEGVFSALVASSHIEYSLDVEHFLQSLLFDIARLSMVQQEETSFVSVSPL
jgi:hypothetical protein